MRNCKALQPVDLYLELWESVGCMVVKRLYAWNYLKFIWKRVFILSSSNFLHVHPTRRLRNLQGVGVQLESIRCELVNSTCDQFDSVGLAPFRVKFGPFPNQGRVSFWAAWWVTLMDWHGCNRIYSVRASEDPTPAMTTSSFCYSPSAMGVMIRWYRFHHADIPHERVDHFATPVLFLWKMSTTGIQL